ncbi:MAG: hypothetical protein R3F30_09845 [Planctomycetota bacterium]
MPADPVVAHATHRPRSSVAPAEAAARPDRGQAALFVPRERTPAVPSR